jgi:hypothetical protein
MMHEHTELAGHIARAFGNRVFQAVDPSELMFYIVSHHDAGWSDFDRDPVTDPNTNLPYNLVETPTAYITRTSRKSPDFNERHHAYCGLMSSMHSWGLYNGRYGLSNLVLINNIPRQDRHLADAMLQGELDRQERLKKLLACDPLTASWLDEEHLLQNYKQLQFFDTLALYFNRTHAAARAEQKFEHVPLTAEKDVTITIKPRGNGTYELAPFPLATSGSEFAYAGRLLEPQGSSATSGWSQILQSSATRWEMFGLVAA